MNFERVTDIRSIYCAFHNIKGKGDIDCLLLSVSISLSAATYFALLLILGVSFIHLLIVQNFGLK